MTLPFSMNIILIGDPVAHSRSPAMQNAAFAHLGLDLRYAAAQTSLADLPARIAALREPGYLGANVTLPHKQAVIPLLDALEPEAAQIGAVNTIYKGAQAAWWARTPTPPACLTTCVTAAWLWQGARRCSWGPAGRPAPPPSPWPAPGWPA
ncbi:MAG: hypothetical protein WCI67_08530 [Chloroflexales bacterium]